MTLSEAKGLHFGPIRMTQKSPQLIRSKLRQIKISEIGVMEND
jgi:hypothetical protein